MTSTHMHKAAAAWIGYQVEREGIARLTILILLLTTVGMLSYTFGYAEGVHNSQGDLAEEIRLPAADRLPSISELRHSSDAGEQEPPPLLPPTGTQPSTQSGGAPPPEDAPAAAAAASNSTHSTHPAHPPVDSIPLPVKLGAVDGAQTAPDSSSSGSSNGGSSSSSSGSDTPSSGDAGVASSDSSSGGGSAGGSASGSMEQQPHSRAGDGSEDDSVTPDSGGEYDIHSDDYGA